MSLKKSPFFELRSGSVDTLLFIVKTTELESVRAELTKRFEATPEFFADDVVAIDVRRLADHERVPLGELNALLSSVRMRPVGVVAPPAQHDWVREAGLPLLDARDARPAAAPEAAAVAADTAAAAPQAEPAPQPAAATESAAPASAAAPVAQVPLFPEEPVAEAPAMADASAAAEPRALSGSTTTLIDRPLRSGQRIYAKGDLVVLAPVSHGAEVIAEGHIHIYAPLRGRALAGVLGNTDARIFCTCLEPELISIAGIYRTTDTPLPDELRGKPVLVRLDEQEKLIVEPLRLS